MLKDMFLNLLQNEEYSTLEIKSLRNKVFERQTREEILLQKLDELHSLYRF